MLRLEFGGPWLPQAVSHPMADGLLNHDAWQTLRQKRIAVVDSAVPLEVVAKVRLWNGDLVGQFFVRGRGW